MKLGNTLVSSSTTHRLPNASSKKVSIVSKNIPETTVDFSRVNGLLSSRSENVAHESLKKTILFNSGADKLAPRGAKQENAQ